LLKSDIICLSYKKVHRGLLFPGHSVECRGIGIQVVSEMSEGGCTSPIVETSNVAVHPCHACWTIKQLLFENHKSPILICITILGHHLKFISFFEIVPLTFRQQNFFIDYFKLMAVKRPTVFTAHPQYICLFDLDFSWFTSH